MIKEKEKFYNNIYLYEQYKKEYQENIEKINYLTKKLDIVNNKQKDVVKKMEIFKKDIDAMFTKNTNEKDDETSSQASENSDASSTPSSMKLFSPLLKTN